tara:strand:+ start:3442 stop:4473 length:1032 start_codon:yes stop_codon:yes gene_type:complete
MKKVIVTGGSGFIGSNLIQLLLKKNYFVVNIDKSSYSANPYNVKSFKKNKKYLFYKLDINQKNKIIKILNKHKPIGIFNLAAETHVDRSIDNAQNFIKTNIFGVYSLLESIKKLKKDLRNKIRFLQISTDEVYGDIPKNKKADEKYNYNPSSPYSASKASADQIIRSYCRTYGLKALIANPCNNYGPNQFPEKFIPKMIFNLLNNRPLPLYGKGKNVREWIYVKDNCEALLKIFVKGKIGQSYNIGTGELFKNIDIIKKILKVSKYSNIKIGKKTKIQFVKDRPGHDLRYSLNSKKIKKEIKWKNKTSISNGLKKTIIWYSQNLPFFKKISKNKVTKRLGLKI